VANPEKEPEFHPVTQGEKPMKRSLFAIVAFAIAMHAVSARGQETATGRALVSTTGSAEIRVAPDLADLNFQIEVRSPDLTKARNEQAERAAKVLAALRTAGVGEAELQTSQVQIVPHYDRETEPFAASSRPPQETASVRFFSVSQDISCTLHDVSKVPQVTTDAVAAGATGVQSASLRTSQLRKYRDQARAQAIRAAKEKAIALAAELGVKVGRPYAITEGSAYEASHWSRFNTGNFQTSSAGGPSSGTETAASTFAPGRISVSASVSVSFILE
jgi:uncharacterized protein